MLTYNPMTMISGLVKSRLSIRDVLFIIGLLVLALIPRLALLHFKGFAIFHTDHAVFGLMAKHILEGKPMIYYYGQGYMGPLDSLMGALIYLIRGMNLFSIQLAPVSFYLLFLIVNFYLLKRVFGLEVSLTANSLLALSPPALTLMCATLGTYPETLFFGSLILLGLVHYLESPKRITLFLTSLAAGLALWNNNLILMYFFAIGLLWFLKSNFWKRGVAASDWRRMFFLRDMGIPIFLRVIGIVIHTVIVLFVLWNTLSFFTGDVVTLGNLKIHMASPPFHVKKVKKILLLFGGEFIVLCWLTQGVKKLGAKIRPWFPLIGGFILGSSPMILYSFLGGEGYRVIHGSGMVLAKELPRQFRAVVWEGFINGICGIPIESLFSGGLAALRAWSVFILVLGLFIYYGFKHRKELTALFWFRPFEYSFSIFPVLLTLIFLLICLFSTLQAGRYLLPSYFSVSMIFALALSRIKTRSALGAGILFLFLLANNGYANFKFIANIQSHNNIKRAYESILRLFESKGIRGGYAHFVTSYVLTFQSQERIIVAPYRSPDRYPAYAKYVDQLDRVAYIFEEEDWFSKPFQRALDENKISYEKIWIDPFWVFVIDRSQRTEKGIV